MTVAGDYLGMPLAISSLDGENLEYFRHCAAGSFRLQRCAACGLLRYPPTTACPWCASPDSTWDAVDGRGVVYSYSEVRHAIQPAFRAHLPYLLLLVELDTQRGQPTADEALRLNGNLVTADATLAPPEMVRARRHRHAREDGVHRSRAGTGAATVDRGRVSPAPARPWRYPE